MLEYTEVYLVRTDTVKCRYTWVVPRYFVEDDAPESLETLRGFFSLKGDLT